MAWPGTLDPALIECFRPLSLHPRMSGWGRKLRSARRLSTEVCASARRRQPQWLAMRFNATPFMSPTRPDGRLRRGPYRCAGAACVIVLLARCASIWRPPASAAPPGPWSRQPRHASVEVIRHPSAKRTLKLPWKPSGRSLERWGVCPARKT
jgi:hypothetical protein